MLFVGSGIFSIVVFVYAYNGPLATPSQSLITSSRSLWLPIQFATVVAADVLLCCSTVYFLLKQSREALPGTAGLLHRLIRLTFQSAAPAAICTMFSFSCGFYFYVQGHLDTRLLLMMVLNMMTPQLYTISAMWTLNSRQSLRSQLSTEIQSDTLATLIEFRPDQKGDAPPM
ncbi:hypothetical protein C8J57DRAFT_1532155 [Mycena rebaudengoi]|nr:hypothetical protein C8J57DRAFT_1532155 [Mycena rebaudengoi]